MLAVFIIYFLTSGSKFISPSMKAVVKTCTGAISLDHLDFRFFMFGSYSRNQEKFTVSLISWHKLIFLVFEGAVPIQSWCEFSWSFGLQSWSTGSILWWFSFFRKQSFLPSIKAGVSTCACAIALDRLDLKIVYVWLTYLVKIRMNLLSVLFWEGSLSSYILRKLFEYLDICLFFRFFGLDIHVIPVGFW